MSPLKAHTTSEEIAQSVARTLLSEARRNELTVAYVRVFTLLMVSVLDWFAYSFPEARLHLTRDSMSVPLLSTSWFLVSAFIAVALRRGFYRSELRFILPVLDGLLIFLLFGNFLRSMGPELFVSLGQLTACGVTCALLAASGSLRLSRLSAYLTTGLALAIYAALSVLSLAWSIQVLVGLAVLVGTGMLSVRMTKVVQRAVESEIGRSTLARFLPEVVISKAHRDPLALLTEPRSVEATILVSDLRGFTARSEKLSPVAVLEMLNEIQGSFAAAVREQGGIVDKFMGDGMLAVFRSLDTEQYNHASRAIATARAMVEGLTPINSGLSEEGLEPIRIGVGIHTGMVVTGCLGSGARLEFTVIGDTVNTASRLEALTKEKRVTALLSDETARRADLKADEIDRIGEVAIRGRKEPMLVHALRVD